LKDREKELKQLIYLRTELIKTAKKEIKQYHQEIEQINGYKKLEKINSIRRSHDKRWSKKLF